MTPRNGQKKLAALFGKRAAWRDSGRPTSPDKRAEAAERAAAAAADHERVKAERDALRARLLADPEYMRLVRETAAAHQARERAFGEARNYRLSIGHTELGFFLVEAEGDNWADALRKLDAKRAGKGGAK